MGKRRSRAVRARDSRDCAARPESCATCRPSLRSPHNPGSTAGSIRRRYRRSRDRGRAAPNDLRPAAAFVRDLTQRAGVDPIVVPTPRLPPARTRGIHRAGRRRRRWRPPGIGNGNGVGMRWADAAGPGPCRSAGCGRPGVDADRVDEDFALADHLFDDRTSMLLLVSFPSEIMTSAFFGLCRPSPAESLRRSRRKCAVPPRGCIR